jgi:DNA primase
VIPPGFLQELLSRTDIVDVVGRHVELKRGGANFMGLCPFHGEKSPSFSVTPAKQFYYCFGCGASGDAIKFLTEHLGLSFVEAVRDLAQAVGLNVPEEQVTPEERQRRDTLRQRRLSLAEVLVRAADFYRGQLGANPRAVDYLKKRGLTGRIAQRFELGFAPPGWRTLAGVFPQYDDPLLEEAGLVRQKDAEGSGSGDREEGEDTAATDRGRYDWFRDRVMFPIRGVDGQVIGFGGRVLDDSKPKYINSPETPLFSKGRELYGLFEARQALREKGFALVVEGYMDVVALAQSGFANAVATLGTACTAEHVQKLFRFTDSVVFSFDGDAAGRRAATRALEAALPHATDVRQVKFLFLPPEHDPDSYVRELGPEAFEREVACAVPLSRQLIEQAADGQDLATAEGRARLVANAQPLWEQLPPGVLQEQILLDIAGRAQLQRDDLARRWGQRAGGRPGGAGSGSFGGRGGSFRRPIAPRAAARLPQDRAARLLLQRSHWWHALNDDDHARLVSLPTWHAELFRWLDRRLTELGPSAWTELRESIGAEPWAAQATELIDGAVLLDEPLLDDLQSALVQLRRPQGLFAMPSLPVPPNTG